LANARFDEQCRSCQALQGIISLTNAPRILETPYWVIEHAHPTSIKGWLVLVLNRHCKALHDLTSEEFAAVGRLLPLACQALHETLHTEKEYVLQLAEGQGFHHVHFHIIARLPEWPETLRGPRVFAGLGEQVVNPLSSEELTALALQIRDYLMSHLNTMDERRS
jgi:diadenosine tetraphosphate (Ap4A) HIT family hydrolase